MVISVARALTGVVAAAMLFTSLMAVAPVRAANGGLPTKPNIVVFYLDDVNPMDGRLWNDPALTPNLYSLFVNNGVEFDHAYGVTPLCCPSRATLLTGLHTHNHGVLITDGRLFDPSENVGKEMTAAGYSSMLIGKYLNLPNLLTADQWTAAGSGWSVFDAVSSSSSASEFQYYYDYTLHTKDQGTLSFGEDPGDHSTKVFGERAVARLAAADRDKPVFQVLSLYNTHFPDIPMPGLESDPRWNACASMPPWDPPSYNEADLSDKPPAMQSLPLLPYPDGFPMDGFCRQMLGVDTVVGNVVNELKVEGRYDNTVFMFAADNGMAWGEHRLGEVKKYPYVTRVPLYFSWPGHWDQETIHEYVSDIDFAPTLCAIAGCALGPFPGGQTGPDGLSLLPLLNGAKGHLDRDALLDDNFESRLWLGVRTTPQNGLGLWHYVEYSSGFKELYDDADDRWELSNVAGQPRYEQIETALHQRIYELFAEGRPNNTATVTVIEDALPDAAQDFQFSGDLGSFQLDDDTNGTLPRKKVISGLAPGDYTLTQTKPEAWTLSLISCPFPTEFDQAAGTITFHLLHNDNITCTIRNVRRRPDVSIAQIDIGPFKGDNVYSSSALTKQTQRRDNVVAGQGYDYFATVQNDGKAKDSFILKASITGPASMVASFWANGVDVTTDVVAGTYQVPQLAAAATASLVIHVDVTPSAVRNDKLVVLLFATSMAEPAAVDVVRATTVR